MEREDEGMEVKGIWGVLEGRGVRDSTEGGRYGR